MRSVRKRARLASSTVTRYSQGSVPGKRKARRSGARSSTEYIKIDPRIMDLLHAQGVDFHYVEVVSATEVIVHNTRVR